jgi:hypothetical protein
VPSHDASTSQPTDSARRSVMVTRMPPNDLSSGAASPHTVDWARRFRPKSRRPLRQRRRARPALAESAPSGERRTGNHRAPRTPTSVQAAHPTALDNAEEPRRQLLIRLSSLAITLREPTN